MLKSGAILSIFGITVSVSFIAPRLGVALAEDRLLPPLIARVGRFGTPTWSIVIVTALALPLALSGTFATIAAINVIARLTTYIPVCLAVLVLRRKMADQYTGFRVPLGPVVPVLGIGVCAWLLLNSTAEKLLFGTGALFIGAFVYLFMRWKYGAPGAADNVPEGSN